jgi:hypothetical protein
MVSRFIGKIKVYTGALKFKLYSAFGIMLLLIALSTATAVLLAVKQVIIVQVGQSRIDVLKQISERSNIIKNNLITVINLYKYNTDLVRYLSQTEAGNVQKNVSELDEKRKNFDVVFKDIGFEYDIVIQGENGFVYSSYKEGSYDFESLKTQLWYKKSYDEQGDMSFVSYKNGFIREKEKATYVFGGFSKIKDASGNVLGTILISVDENVLESLYAGFETQGNVYIFDKKGNVVSSRDKSILGKNMIGAENFRKLYGNGSSHIIKKLGKYYFLSNCYDSQTGWTIVEEIPCEIMFSVLINMTGYLAVSMVVFLFTAAFISYRQAKSISKPIASLCQSMKRVSSGEFICVQEENACNEVLALGKSFNSMSGKIKELLEDIRNNEKEKRKSEMDFLRAQINPHFLYNTLFSIQCMAELNKIGQAVKMIKAFIALLRKTLSTDRDLIPLREELENTKSYLELERIRYSNIMDYEIEVSKELESCQVPALILQPIVENAIFHGLEAKDSGGLIVLEVLKDGEDLLINISDDGKGMNIRRLKEVRARINLDEDEARKSIGLVNVSGRIKINFGKEYGLTIDSEENIGTCVSVRLPIIKGTEYEDTYSG